MSFGMKLCAFAFSCMGLGVYGSDLSEIDHKLVMGYAKACVRENGLDRSLNNLRDTASVTGMGFRDVCGLYMKARHFNKRLIKLETTICGTESEFLQPEKYLLAAEATSLRGRLLLEIARRRAESPEVASSILLSKHTKCASPAYHRGASSGSIDCVTFVSKEKMAALLQEACSSRNSMVKLTAKIEVPSSDADFKELCQKIDEKMKVGMPNFERMERATLVDTLRDHS